ncbi:hypothetical protein PF005_g10831 [Phytophthora fragariae]|uniref:Secreted protein n=2 Tax=Phytophthora TaxID=4783 RepID=A0A6A3KZD7_9STRA|nr:hypothetical protein PF003_g16375 [Phytophthora fragariae]KAE9040402.1 hypothetical protein PR002_g4967 [Phytophthora rubi]KAE8937863.1 hypothetical protein PF009_g12244 [Phytophthora fragariae]KAE9011047.1 hypothetical protein PF011_g9542 [Phytophthora fragariae]KAE9050725.1 hypothetical protein PR001_g2143 [Phytophthora rubi]
MARFGVCFPWFEMLLSCKLPSGCKWVLLSSPGKTLTTDASGLGGLSKKSSSISPPWRFGVERTAGEFVCSSGVELDSLSRCAVVNNSL